MKPTAYRGKVNCPIGAREGALGCGGLRADLFSDKYQRKASEGAKGRKKIDLSELLRLVNIAIYAV